MPTTFNSPTTIRTSRAPHGFSLVEVTLAVAIVAIGIVGILALFPLGMDAVRKAADDTQMMTIGQDIIAYFQQNASPANHYSLRASEVISNESSYSINTTMDGIYYHVDVVVTNGGFSSIYDPSGLTNMISRVQIAVYRTTPTYTPLISNTVHYYFTEVDRYVQ
ncbi:MAG: prepilin-type N-terminal cleavage/methylation domain-containing protein [Verrucomicrobiota bacterium]